MKQKLKKLKLLLTISLAGLLLFACQVDKDLTNKNLYEKNGVIMHKKFEELIQETQFKTAFDKISKPKKGSSYKANATSKTVMEEQYGFTITDYPANVIVSDSITSYTFLITRENTPSNVFENLIIKLKQNQDPKALILKYESVSSFDDIPYNYYTFKGTRTLESIIYNASPVNSLYDSTECEIIIDWICNGAGQHSQWVEGCTGHEGGGATIICTGGGYTPNTGGGGGYSYGGDTGDYVSHTGGGGVPTSPVAPTYTSINLTTALSLNPAQEAWINAPSQFRIKKDLQIYLFSNPFDNNAITFANEFISNSVANPDLQLDFNLSRKSPAFIDMSSINGNSPEEIKFREIYNSLTQSPLFKQLFINMFGATPLFNVKFSIVDIPQTGIGHTDGRCRLPNPNNSAPFNIIEIDRSHLLTKSKVNIALTILHECIHAYLNIKLRNPSIGMSISDINNLDFQACVNTYYNNFSGNQNQHSFFVDNMIPTMVNILNNIKDLIVTPTQANQVENPTNGGVFLYQPMGSPPYSSSIQIPWNWTDFFTHLSYMGLQSSTAYPDIYPLNSNINFIREKYIIAFDIIFNP